jgi:thiosulfate/3-mercaptopyruvate sulfurtransferase
MPDLQRGTFSCGPYCKTNSRFRFNGTAPEPRQGLQSGHIPNSFSLPFHTLLERHQTQNGTSYTSLRPAEELRKIILESISVDGRVPPGELMRRFVNTCGSGMTAATIWLALQQIGVDSSIYDEVCSQSLSDGFLD